MHGRSVPAAVTGCVHGSRTMDNGGHVCAKAESFFCSPNSRTAGTHMHWTSRRLNTMGPMAAAEEEEEESRRRQWQGKKRRKRRKRNAEQKKTT